MRTKLSALINKNKAFHGNTKTKDDRRVVTIKASVILVVEIYLGMEHITMYNIVWVDPFQLPT